MTSIMFGILGFLAGLLWCYWSKLQAAYENRGILGAAGGLIGAGQTFVDEVKKL